MKQVSLNQLSPEEKAALMKEALALEAAKQKEIEDNRKAYKALVNETIPVLFDELKVLSALLSEKKKFVYDSVQSLIKLKAEAYNRDNDQTTHSFTTEDGKTIIVGFRELDSWDDTVNVGIGKINDCLDSFVQDDNSKALVKAIRQLLTKDKNGNLKASRVLALKKMAEESGNAELIDAIKIIQDAYRPVPSKRFITCRYKDAVGNTVDLPLSISEVEFPENSNTPK